jgi:hypothetical protein
MHSITGNKTVAILFWVMTPCRLGGYISEKNIASIIRAQVGVSMHGVITPDNIIVFTVVRTSDHTTKY